MNDNADNPVLNFGPNPNQFEPLKAERLRLLIRCYFPVDNIRLLTGAYQDLANYYVKNRIESYEAQRLVLHDLGEAAFEDFQDWQESDFKRIDSRLLRDLRNHLLSNGIQVEKRAGLHISRAMSTVFADPEAIPYSNGNVTFRQTSHEEVPLSGNGTNSESNAAGQNDGGSNQQETSASAARSQGSARLTDVTRSLRKEHMYSGLPDEDFDVKSQHFLSCLELGRVSEEEDKLAVLPFFLSGQAALTYRTELSGKVKTVAEALSLIKEVFLSDEARRANDTIWESLSFSFVQSNHGTTSKRETLRVLFSEIERLRNCTSSAAKAGDDAMEHITRAKLLSAVSGMQCFAHVRANPPEEYLRLRSALYDAATQADTNVLVDAKGYGASMYTDREVKRKFRNNAMNLRIGRKITPRNDKMSPRYAGRDNSCWVCGKEGCHSTKHHREERSQRKSLLTAYAAAALNDGDASTDGEYQSCHEDVDEEVEVEANDSDYSSLVSAMDLSAFVMRNDANPADFCEFFGVALDTGCSQFCTVSKDQYFAYCRYTGQKPELNTKMTASFGTSGGKVKSMGTVWITIPLGKLVKKITVLTHVIDSPSTAPFLLAYSVMKENRWNMIIAQTRLQSEDDPERYVEYEEISGLPVYRWHPSANVVMYFSEFVSLYTLQELRNIHRRAGHPSTGRLMRILQRIESPEELPVSTRSMLKRVEKSCRACQLNGKTPERFRFLLTDESRFNHEVLVDILKLSDGQVLHVICSGTRYQLGMFVESVSSRYCWHSIQMCWSNILSGNPNIVRTDAGTNFDGKEFRDLASSAGVHVDVVPTEAHNKIGMVERYHKVVRDVYEKLKLEDSTMDKHLRLSIAFRCINDSVGIDGLVPTLLVFGVYPKLVAQKNLPASTTVQRANAIHSATKLASRLLLKERVRRAALNGPAANLEIIKRVRGLISESPIIVYREKSGWTGPHRFIAADDHGVWYRNEKGNEIRVALHVVKPYIPESWSFFTKLSNPIFAGPRKEELDGLFRRKCIKLVDASKARGHRVYHGRWVEVVKVGGKARSRLVVCATDEDLELQTYAPTVQRISTRIGFCYASCRPDITISCRDVTQAFIQSDTNLRRPIYMELPHELCNKTKESY